MIVALITALIAGFMAVMFWAERRTEGRSRSDHDKLFFDRHRAAIGRQYLRPSAAGCLIGRAAGVLDTLARTCPKDRHLKNDGEASCASSLHPPSFLPPSSRHRP